MTRMKRVFLTEHLPATTDRPNLAADVKQKLEAYRREKKQYLNQPPDVRPIAMDKYEVNKEQSLVTAVERDSQLAAVGTAAGPKKSNAAVVNTLPKRAQPRARRLLPYLEEIDIVNLELQHVLYDLTVDNVKKIKSSNYALLKHVIRQLDSNRNIPAGLYVRKAPGERVSRKKLPYRGPSKQSKPDRVVDNSWDSKRRRYFSTSRVGQPSVSAEWI